MIYSKKEDLNSIKTYLQLNDLNEGVKESGIPVIYDDNLVYTLKGGNNTLIIDSIGTDKIQNVLLPYTMMTMLSGDSLIISDPTKKIYTETNSSFKRNGYNVISLDFDESKECNCYNPLNLAYQYYKEGDKDKCTSILEETGHYLFLDLNTTADPFWTYTTIDYFVGLCLYLFGKNDNEVNLMDVFKLANKLTDENEKKAFLNEVSNDDTINSYVVGTLTSPNETMGGIIATFNQRIRLYISKEKLVNMMSKNDFDIKNIMSEKTAIFIHGGLREQSKNLIPLFIHQVVESNKSYTTKLNIVLDEFDNLIPIKNFADVINQAKNYGISFTCVIKTLFSIMNIYGKNEADIIRVCFPNVIYLYANDLFTLNEISVQCGGKNKTDSISDYEELKTLQPNEAIIIMPRVMPFKSELKNYSQVNWPTK